jgi:hypothetical protein
MVLTNAEKQARWRAKRNKLAKQASSIKGLIAGLVRSVNDKTDQEIQEIADEVWDRFQRAMRGKDSTRGKPGTPEPTPKPKQPTKPALVWGNNFDGIMFVAKIERGTQYIVCSTLWGGGGRPGFTARRRTRSGSGDFMLGHADTSEQAKQLCERHYAGRKD